MHLAKTGQAILHGFKSDSTSVVSSLGLSTFLRVSSEGWQQSQGPLKELKREISNLLVLLSFCLKVQILPLGEQMAQILSLDLSQEEFEQLFEDICTVRNGLCDGVLIAVQAGC